MIIKDVIITDFLNYKEPAMYVAFPYCTFKCEKECGIKCCQNSDLARSPNCTISAERLVEIYGQNAAIDRALVLCGLEPLDSFTDVLELIAKFREKFTDPVVIYTGYREDECVQYVQDLQKYSNILVKFGRFIPGMAPHRDPILGVDLIGDQQYCKKIS